MITKEEYHRYRDRARELYADVHVVPDVEGGLREISIPLNAPVQSCEDGAFVEAVVWVPKEALK